MNTLLARGNVWSADLEMEVEGKTQGHEQGDQRPVLIVSTDTFNNGPAELLVVVPLTRTMRNWNYHVVIGPPEGGLQDRSVALCEQVRCISTLRLIRYCGTISTRTMLTVGDALADLLELWEDQ